MQHAKQGEQVAGRDLQSKGAGMSDIVARLRDWRSGHLATLHTLHLLMYEAADEIERLRQVSSQKNLTDEEREAVEAASRIIDGYDEEMDGFPSGAAATLRGLLERTK